MTLAPPTAGAAVGPFDLYGPLPSGTTLLEASAGTGKTYAIATLTARFIADGWPLESLLVITFTRAATGELRARVRDRLLSARDGLARALAGDESVSAEDPLVALLCAGDRAVTTARRDHLARALSQFDAATIETTHGFCRRVLDELGVDGDSARSLTLVEDVGDLLEQVVDDLYVRKYVHRSAPDLTRADAVALAREVLAHPSALLAPPPSDGGDVASVRRRLAAAVRDEVERRKRAAGVLTYDDVLLRLRDTLADGRRGPAACGRLRARYRVVLIDEFQDTDPVQWEIVRRAFAESGTTLVLIGDPKQAIYAFRGADVQAYLAAAGAATRRATLATNWRSDGPLLRALDALLLGAQLGDPAIVYNRIAPAARNDAARLSGAPVDAALRIRRVSNDAVERTTRGDLAAPAARRFVADDLAAEVATLLASPAELEVEARDESGKARSEHVRPGHLAVLVRTNGQAALIREALVARDVPAVVVAPGSVFQTAQADEWLRLLDALDQPTSRARAAAAAVTCFLGWNARALALADDAALDRLHGQLHTWAAVLRERGVASLLAAIEGATRLPARVLRYEEGERLLTDLHHVGELLHAEATRSGLGPAALATWLRTRIAEADKPAADGASAEERSRRLESDAAAVQVLTIHRSKGLEFPVVYLPFPWAAPWNPDEFPVFHDPAAGGVRTLDVGGKKRAGFAAHLQLAIAEELGEDLRLLYVALTRARHQVVCWWAPATGAGRSPLGRILFSQDASGAVGDGGKNPDDTQVAARLAALVATAPGCVAVETAAPSPATYRTPKTRSGELTLARLDRGLDTAWRRLSYTSLTAPAHDGEEAPEDVTADEALSGAVLPSAGDEAAHLRAIPASLASAPGGASFGTIGHGVLKHTDFAADDLAGALRVALDGELAWRRVDVGDRSALVEGLGAALATPLGPSLGGLRLDEVSRADRLDELGFELPLVGGDRPHGALELDELGALLAECLPADDPVAEYAPRLSDPTIQASLRGYLTGSLDLVLRTPEGAFAVCDYKTNRLDSGEGPLTAHDYRPAALSQEMALCHYPLQALFYLVALHRYLRWRMPDYDPGRHLAGAHYLFVRGMTGNPDARVGDQPCGVWSWRPPARAIEAVSDLLDEGTTS